MKPRDPSKPSPKAWEDSEIAQLKQMVAEEGPGKSLSLSPSLTRARSLSFPRSRACALAPSLCGFDSASVCPGHWESKAARLGSGRTAKALHTRWLRDEGRIIDRPRTATDCQSLSVSISTSLPLCLCPCLRFSLRRHPWPYLCLSLCLCLCLCVCQQPPL